MFKGGTSLRIVYQSPRFSEVLDFTAAMPFHKTKSVIERTAVRVAQEIAGLELVESKPATGGYFGIVRGPMGPWQIEILLQASSRRKPMKGELSWSRRASCRTTTCTASAGEVARRREG